MYSGNGKNHESSDMVMWSISGINLACYIIVFFPKQTHHLWIV